MPGRFTFGYRTVFSPASLSFTGWWRANGTGGSADFDPGVSWDPTASAGASGLNGYLGPADTLAVETYNGHDAANLSGAAGKYLVNQSGIEADAFIPDASNVFYIGIVARARTTYDGDVGGFAWLCGDQGSAIALQVYESATTQVIRGIVNGVVTVQTTWSIGVEHFVEFWCDGTNLKLRVDGGSIVTGDPISVNTITTVGQWVVGADGSGAISLDGVVLEHFISSQDLSANGTNLLTYIDSRYDLDLTPFPRTLPLTGWWCADYTGGDPGWYPQISTGTSASSGPFTETSNAPAVGSPVEFWTPADFDGSLHRLDNTNDQEYFFNDTSYSIVALFWADTADAPAGGNEEPAIWNGQGNGGPVLSFSTSGVRLEHNDGDWSGPVVACSTGTWHMAFGRYNGTDIELGIDSGSLTTVTQGNVVGLTGDTVQLGRNWNGGHLFDGKLLEIMVTDTVLSDTDRTNIRSYFNTRYGLSL